jgi:hypothetical protein
LDGKAYEMSALNTSFEMAISPFSGMFIAVLPKKFLVVSSLFNVCVCTGWWKQ